MSINGKISKSRANQEKRKCSLMGFLIWGARHRWTEWVFSLVSKRCAIFGLQSFGCFGLFLDKKLLLTPVEVIFCINGLSTKNFSSKFQLWAKMIAAPPGSRTQIKKISRETSSGMFKGTKNMFLFFGHFFNSFWPVQANGGIWMPISHLMANMYFLSNDRAEIK